MKPNLLPGFAVVVLIVLLPAVYMGAYYAMLDDNSPTALVEWSVHHSDRVIYLPEYRIKGDIVESIFWPAHEIDRRIRPRNWASHYLDT